MLAWLLNGCPGNASCSKAALSLVSDSVCICFLVKDRVILATPVCPECVQPAAHEPPPPKSLELTGQEPSSGQSRNPFLAAQRDARLSSQGDLSQTIRERPLLFTGDQKERERDRGIHLLAEARVRIAWSQS